MDHFVMLTSHEQLVKTMLIGSIT